jgi:hypothetical protein
VVQAQACLRFEGSDRTHPLPHGTYLAAVFYRVGQGLSHAPRAARLLPSRLKPLRPLWPQTFVSHCCSANKASSKRRLPRRRVICSGGRLLLQLSDNPARRSWAANSCAAGSSVGRIWLFGNDRRSSSALANSCCGVRSYRLATWLCIYCTIFGASSASWCEPGPGSGGVGQSRAR